VRGVIQRVSSARVDTGGTCAGAIGPGLLVLVGVATGDSPEDAIWLARKIAGLRIFPDEAGQMNRSVRETGGAVLVVSQFTLVASTRKGNRPSYNEAARPEEAIPRYDAFLAALEAELGAPVARGVFGADMQVSLVNDGPVTLVIDSRLRE
jgi:D-aminoacyl-tRNA deacylase